MRRVWTLMAAMAACGGSAQGQALYGVSNFGNFQVQSLVRIDAATGAATTIGSTGLTQIVDIAYDRGAGVMYAYTVGADLYSLDLQTGAATLIGAQTGVIPEGGLAFDAVMGRLIANSASDVLGVHTATGARSVIGPFGTSDTDISGLAFDGSGRLVALAKNGTLEDTLLSIDPMTGQGTLIGGMGVSSASGVGGLAYSPELGTLFMSDGGSLYAVNPATGAASLIGVHGAPEVSGIAFIPAPGGAILAASGLVLATRRRRRCAVRG